MHRRERRDQHGQVLATAAPDYEFYCFYIGPGFFDSYCLYCTRGSIDPYCSYSTKGATDYYYVYYYYCVYDGGRYSGEAVKDPGLWQEGLCGTRRLARPTQGDHL